MSGGWRIPAGFEVFAEGRSTLIALESCSEELRAAGLSRVGTWQELLQTTPARPGRGGSAVLELPSGLRARLKQVRRGGWVAPLRREHFIGPRRLLANLSTSREALLRGVRTPGPLASLAIAEGRGFYRGWLALEDFPDATDLLSCFASGDPPDREELKVVLAAVREMHDLGLEHRDLNLGNLLLRRRGAAAPEAMIIDLDRARLHPTSLPFHLRQQALRRLERSHVKSLTTSSRLGEIRDLYYALYAAGDGALGRKLERGRSVGRLWIRIHRLGWRR